MLELMFGAVVGAILLLVVGTSARGPSIFIHAVILIVYLAGTLKSSFPIRYVLAIVLGYASINLILRYRGTRSRGLRVALIVAIGAVVAAVAWMIAGPLLPVSASDGDALFRHFVLSVLAATFGFVAVATSHGSILKRAYIFWSLTMAALATVESASGGTLLPRFDIERSLVRDGAQRAILGSEHPLVLAALLVAAAPFVVRSDARWQVRCAMLGLLTAGVYATGSRGALIVLALAVGAAILGGLQPAGVEARKAGLRGLSLLVIVPITFAAILAASVLVAPSDAVLSSNVATEASTQYRIVLYQYLFASLRDAPFGWGVGGLPDGLYLVPSAFGIKDLAETVDSEPALLVFKWGWLGLATFLGVFGWLAVGRRLRDEFGLASLAIVTSGLFLALNAWTGLSTALAIFLGATLKSAMKPYSNSRDTGSNTQSTLSSGQVRIAPPIRSTGKGGAHRRL